MEKWIIKSIYPQWYAAHRNKRGHADTGVDVRELVNLLNLSILYSLGKMIGREEPDC
jgi:hypothetical protein